MNQNSNLGWFLGLYMKDIEDDQTLLDAQFTITIHNTSETQLGTSFRQTYLTIMPGKEEIVYKGSFRDFWYEGGALIIHNNETKLTYSVVVNSEYQSVLKNPIRLYLYTRDAPIFP